MQYSVDERANQEWIRGAIVSGLLADSLSIPVMATYFLDHPAAARLGYVLAATASMAVSLVYLAIRLWIQRRTGQTISDPRLGFVVVCFAVLADAFLELASNDPLGFYRPILLVGVAFVVLIGDDRMTAAMCTLVVALVAWTAWAEGIRGRSLATEVVIYGALAVVLAQMTRRSVRSLHRTITTRDALQSLAEATTHAGTVDEVILAGLPMVNRVLDVDRAVVVAHGPSTADGCLPEVFARWPAEAPEAPPTRHSGRYPMSDERAWWNRPALHAACRDVRSVVDDDLCCFIPVGYRSDQLLVLVTEPRRPGRNNLTHTRSAADEVGSVFLRLTSRAATVAALHSESRTDALTGLPNRRSFDENLARQADQASRAGRPLSIVMIDLDHFKDFNDTYGHQAGDAVLSAVGHTLADTVRRQDVVARFGGEEFCLVLPDTESTGAVDLMEHIRHRLAQHPEAGRVTLSAGIATALPAGTIPAETAAATTTLPSSTAEPVVTTIDLPLLLHRADAALYRAKAAGRNCSIVDDQPDVLSPMTRRDADHQNACR